MGYNGIVMELRLVWFGIVWLRYVVLNGEKLRMLPPINRDLIKHKWEWFSMFFNHRWGFHHRLVILTIYIGIFDGHITGNVPTVKRS